MVLSLSSLFFKNIFNDLQAERFTFILPNYTTAVVSAFVQFFYVGEISIDETYAEEFASLCHEFNCEEIDVIKTLITNYENKADSSNLSMIDVPKNEFDEYFETSGENVETVVETIFFNENENNEGGF